ncbi:hypothetical protein ACMGDH_03625 [Sphingomonas sp. DT-207]|uniref:hypothetical protein n=1 Tax=Sphingomonas sp. DT-207 TaxID=3396167 RepID=UPI003F1D829B
MTRRLRLDFLATRRIVRVLPLALLASILLHALAPASAAPAFPQGSTFRADTANVCVAAASGPQFAQIPIKRTPAPLPIDGPAVCSIATAAVRPLAIAPVEPVPPIPAAAPSHHRGGTAPRAPPQG